jgi:hypothetical protein
MARAFHRWTLTTVIPVFGNDRQKPTTLRGELVQFSTSTGLVLASTTCVSIAQERKSDFQRPFCIVAVALVSDGPRCEKSGFHHLVRPVAWEVPVMYNVSSRAPARTGDCSALDDCGIWPRRFLGHAIHEPAAPRNHSGEHNHERDKTGEHNDPCSPNLGSLGDVMR